MKSVMAAPGRVDGLRADADLPSARPAARMLALLVLAAIALRLIIFLGRGDYVAFDEGWYLLLARNLFEGEGFTLTGLRHVTLSPLFPILTGIISTAVENPIWAGRLLAACAGGLLVWPCWYIFERLADRRTAWIACVFITVLPSLAPFAAPYWIGWDLWVGAEPLLHVLLYTGIAFAVRAWLSDRTVHWALSGCFLALAYLARPEAILPLGVLGLVLVGRAVWLRTSRHALHVLAFGLAFALTASPYWIYLHDALGRWTLTGRGVQVTAPRSTSAAGDNEGAPAGRIERMLWEDGQRAYMYSLYSLDPSGTRLASAYWGIPQSPQMPNVSAAARTAYAPVVLPEPAISDTVPPAGNASAPRPGRWSLYARALAVVAPWYIWPFVLLGLFGARRAGRLELLVAVPLLLTSLAIARIVAVDPRTQLFLAPLAAFYAARGVREIGIIADRRLEPGRIRPGFLAGASAAILALLMLATEARWVYLGLRLGSPHHLVGSANRRAGEALRDIVPAGEPVMSWHPALALYARREWRVLPHAPFADMVRYAGATGSEYVVLSAYYPSPLETEQMPGEYLLVRVPPDAAGAVDGLQLRIDRVNDTISTGRVQPVTR